MAVRGKYPSTLRDIIQCNLYTLSRWTGENGLVVNLAKTELILVTQPYKIHIADPISFNVSVIKLAESAKYLGVILDFKLSFRPNLLEREKKVTIAL